MPWPGVKVLDGSPIPTRPPWDSTWLNGWLGFGRGPRLSWRGDQLQIHSGCRSSPPGHGTSDQGKGGICDPIPRGGPRSRALAGWLTLVSSPGWFQGFEVKQRLQPKSPNSWAARWLGWNNQGHPQAPLLASALRESQPVVKKSGSQRFCHFLLCFLKQIA